MIRKASQFWIEDPLRKVSQPVLFITQAGSEADITGKDSLGAMFVRSARTINSGDLPLFKHYAVNADGVKFTYTRIFDRESVLIEVPHRLVVSVRKKLSRWYTVTKLRPAFEISDENGDITGIIICNGDNWTESGKYYSIDKDKVDPFEYGNWMCYYNEKPFDNDLGNKVIRRDGRVTITDIAPCGYHGVVVPYQEYSLETLTDPSIDHISQSMCVLNETIDTGIITLHDGTTTIYNIVTSMMSLSIPSYYTPNCIFGGQSILAITSYYSLTSLSTDEEDNYTILLHIYLPFTSVSTSCSKLSSNFCTNIVTGVGTETTSELWLDPEEILLTSPTVSNYYNSSRWSSIYVSGIDTHYTSDSATEILEYADNTVSVNINLIVSGNILSAFSIANTTLYGSGETLVRVIFYAPLLSSLRTYYHKGITYVIGSLMEYEIIGEAANPSPKSTYFIVNSEDLEVHTLSLDSLYTSGSMPYNQLDDEGNRLCYGKFRLIEIEERIEVKDA